MSPCYGLLRHFVAKISHLGVNVSHNEMEICFLAPYGRGGKKDVAFTLAEVLITLGVIGVVAAMTIPTLISKIQKQQIEAQIRENYSSVVQAIRMANADDAVDLLISANSTQSMKEWFETFLAPYMKVEQTCFQTAGCWHKKGVVKTLNHRTPAFETEVGLGDSTIGWGTMTFRTAKGAYFDLDGSSPGVSKGTFGINTTQNTLQFYFDVNGDKKPNVIGKDIYILVYEPDRGLIPAGSDKTKEEVKKNCESENGYWCLGYVKDNGWKISDSVWKRTK